MCEPLAEMAEEPGLCGETEERCTKSDRTERDPTAWAFGSGGVPVGDTLAAMTRLEKHR